MPETDVTKMKVAELKRELKLRGLPINGNKNELQDRLQTALIEGEISLDTVITDDVLEEDVDLTDEDENKLLVDENELLKSPISTPTAADLLLSSPGTIDTASGAATTTISPPKKIVLKRENSIKLISTSTALDTEQKTVDNAESTSASKENVVCIKSGSEAATTTLGGHKAIVVGDKIATTENGSSKKITELSMKERLELRAKRFGVQAATTPAENTKSAYANKTSSASILENNGNKETEEKQIEALKRRAERFGCVVSQKLAKQDAVEKLKKRKERFGLNPAPATVSDNKVTVALEATNSGGATSDIWAEKARARLERFKVNPPITNTTTGDGTASSEDK